MRAHHDATWHRLTRRCKNAERRPFVKKDLEGVMAKWKNNKCTGLDRISMEAIRFLAGRLARLLWLFNDILYRGQLPPKLDEGLAVLLPKARSPCPHQRNATVDVERQLSAVATEQWMQVAGDRPQ